MNYCQNSVACGFVQPVNHVMIDECGRLSQTEMSYLAQPIACFADEIGQLLSCCFYVSPGTHC